MAKFMLLLTDDPSEYATMSPAELQAVIARYMAWSDRLGAEGKLVGGEKLADEGGKLLRKEGGKVVVRTGPYAELREVVSGFFIVQAADYDEAVAIAQSCPHADSRGSISVRCIESTG
ncbi:YciI family protein [Gemmatimonas sp.]|uniref:YciI family protein n=1 Tax=Gemmatimonas sp. TaxID=1962908 RepID=UPI00334220C1